MSGPGQRSAGHADEVSMFPTLEMAAPRAVVFPSATAPSSSSGRHRQKIKTKLPVGGGNATAVLPGLLKTSKPSIEPGRLPNADDFLSFVGFNATHVYFDGQTIKPMPPPDPTSYAHEEPKQSIIDMSLQALIDDSPPTSPQQNPGSRLGTGAGSPNKAKREARGRGVGADPVVDELRNYTALLDKFSLHNFMIYNGLTLRDTPEFQSFRRTYNHEWGAIAVIIALLEKLMKDYSVKLAIINGPCLYDLASLNLVAIEREELLTCVSNIDQVKPQLKSLFGHSDGGGDGAGAGAGAGDELDAMSHKHRAAVICQSLIRRFLATRRVRRLRSRIAAATLIQSVARARLYRRVGLERMRAAAVASEARWADHRRRLAQLWVSLQPDSSTSSASTSASQQRVVVHIPSLSAAEYIRLDMDNMRALQNASIGVLAQLADPDVTLVFVTACPLGQAELAYHDRFLALLGISTLPRRLHFVVPEMLHR